VLSRRKTKLKKEELQTQEWREQESIDLRAQKTMKGKVELSIMPHVV
jgi:hypothetical protein